MKIVYQEIFDTHEFIDSIIAEIANAMTTNLPRTWETRVMIDVMIEALSAFAGDGGLRHVYPDTLMTQSLNGLMVSTKYFRNPEAIGEDDRFILDKTHAFTTSQEDVPLSDAVNHMPPDYLPIFEESHLREKLSYIEHTYGLNICNLFKFKLIMGLQIVPLLVSTIKHIRISSALQNPEKIHYDDKDFSSDEIYPTDRRLRDTSIFTTMWNNIMNFSCPTFIIREDRQQESFIFRAVAHFEKGESIENPVLFGIDKVMIESNFFKYPERS